MGQLVAAQTPETLAAMRAAYDQRSLGPDGRRHLSGAEVLAIAVR